MPFSAHDLRYNLEANFPALYTYLHHRAQRFLGSLQFDADEVDQVVEHVIEQLVRLGVAGGGDEKPLTPLDSLTNAQFYAFLNRSVEHKAIDRLRKRRLLVSSFAELEKEGTEAENNPLNEVTESVWGAQPFPTPEEIALKLASTQELRVLLRHCIEALKKAPHQLQAVLQELEEFGTTALLRAVTEDLKETSYVPEASLANSSQHRDHAHKKLRICLQRKSSNLAVIVALRLTEYGEHTVSMHQEVTVDIQILAQDNLSEDDVRIGLKRLAAEGILNWHDEEIVHLTAVQKKRLRRFYKFE